MSEYKGRVPCPNCRYQRFVIENWDTYLSVLCGICGRKMGEIRETS